MNIIIIDDVLPDPAQYIRDIYTHPFIDVPDGDKVFKNMQTRPLYDMFTRIVVSFLGDEHTVAWNFVRKSPEGQDEPNYIHTDEMMGDVTAILYLSQHHPDADGTTIYDEQHKPCCVVYSKFNRMVIFASPLPHSRNIYENFGAGDDARLIQVAFLKQSHTDE